MDTLIIHIMILITTIPAFIILLKLLKRANKGFLVFMYVGLLLLLGHIAFFSTIRIIVGFLQINVDAGFFNWWSLFIRLQTPVTFLGIGILALLEQEK